MVFRRFRPRFAEALAASSHGDVEFPALCRAGQEDWKHGRELRVKIFGWYFVSMRRSVQIMYGIYIHVYIYIYVCKDMGMWELHMIMMYPHVICIYILCIYIYICTYVFLYTIHIYIYYIYIDIIYTLEYIEEIGWSGDGVWRSIQKWCLDLCLRAKLVYK